jgi:RNA polymerase sigma-70 factor (ECF subfamily)
MSGGLTRSREQRLISRAAGGDREASGALIAAHQHGVYAYILRLCGRGDVAEDVVQEAFVRVLTNLDRFDPQYRFSTWLFTIARRVLLNHLEKRRPRPDSERMQEATGRSCGSTPGVEVDEHRAVCRDAVQAALMRLTMEQREVLVLFHQHDWPIWLIADHLRMPEGTIKSHLHRGRIKLREALERHPAMTELKTRVSEEAWLR